MFCTLQEAYNVPSFDNTCKKKKTLNIQAKTSADPYEPSVEGFENPNKEQDTPVTYRGKANDYEYYRKQYGVELPVIEGFQANQGKKPPTCNVQAPVMYKIPISDEAKEMYDQAMQTSMTEEVPKYVPTPMPARKVNMDNVAGYYDEELEKYLQTKDMRTVPPPPEPAPPVVDAEPSPNPKVVEPDNTPNEVIMKTIISDQSWQNFWDIFLFVFAGVLIMFLCEQLFKLAMMLGMKRTVEILQPYLK